MMNIQKRKYILLVAGVLVLALIVTIVVTLCGDDTKYSNFRTLQLKPVDLALFGETHTNGTGFNSYAYWVGESYACTMEQDGQTCERISAPYVQWLFTDVVDSGHWSVIFCVGERAMSEEMSMDTPSPWRYSNIEVTIAVGKQTGLNEIVPTGWIMHGNRQVENYEEVPLESAALYGTVCLTEKELEEELAENRTSKDIRMNTTAFMVRQSYAIRLRLPENRSWKSPGYAVSGADSRGMGRFAVSCRPTFYNRYGESKTEFPQTVYFKVSYDVENTVTGERSSHSTGWLQQDYVSKLRR